MFPLVIDYDDPIGGKANGRNYITHIAMWKGAKEYLAVKAQEVCEWRYKTWRGLYTSAPLIALLWLLSDGHWGAKLALSVLIYFACYWIMRKRGLVEMELRGHAIEIHVAVKHYGRLYEVKLEEEAAALDRHYGQFNGWTREDIRKALLRKGEWAARNYSKYT